MKKETEGLKLNRKILWAIVSAVIAVCTIYTVIQESGEISLASLWAMIRGGDPCFLVLAILGMFGYVFFEGAALRCIVNRTEAGAGMTQLHGFLYAAADVYFSAITPSATGGQPASLYFMKKDGLPFYLSSAALVLNLAMYNAAIVLIGIVCMVLCPGLFLQFNLPCKVLILIGYVALTGLMAGFLLLLRKGDWIKAIGGALILLFHKLHLLRKPDRLIQRLDRLVKNYGECAALFLGDKVLLRNAFFYNLAQRACQIAVSSCIFVCIGGNPAMFFQIFALQSFAVIGSNCIPIPGAMGVVDYLMLSGFSMLMPRNMAAHLELLSRGISFYFCVVICLLIIAGGYLRRRASET